MEKLIRRVWTIAEALICLLTGATLFYLPLIASKFADSFAVTHPGWMNAGTCIKFFGYMLLAMFLFAAVYEFFHLIAFRLILGAFIGAPCIQLFLAYFAGIGNVQVAFEMVCLSLFCVFCGGIAIAADCRDEKTSKIPSFFGK